MKIELLEFRFRLPGCESIKQKRHELAALREHFGRQHNIALCESGFQDLHDQSIWSFVIVGQDQKQVDQTISAIERYVNESLDAEVCEVQRSKI